jgi:hypothetical protein
VILGPDLMAMRGIIAGELVRAGAAQQFYEAGPRQGWNKVAVYLEAEMQAGRLRRRMAGLLPCICCPDTGRISADFPGWRGERGRSGAVARARGRGVEIFMAWYGL